MARIVKFSLLFACTLLAACDMLGIESPEKAAALREADGKAVGGACRHAGRAIEDCYLLNKKAERAAVFAGWREMNDYMRENKIDAVAPMIPVALPASAAAAGDEEHAEAKADGKAENKTDKAVAKAGGKAKAKAHES